MVRCLAAVLFCGIVDGISSAACVQHLLVSASRWPPVPARSSMAARSVPAASAKLVLVQASSAARCLLTVIVNFNA